RLNRDHAQFLLSVRRGDATATEWALTAAFYSGLHCIEAHLAGAGIHCTTHKERRETMADPRHNIPDEVRLAYRWLQTWSEQARYDLIPFETSIVENAALGYLLKRITDWIQL